MKKLTVSAAAFGAALLASVAVTAARAAEFPIGEPVEKNGMEIGAVYLQPVIMEPMMPGMKMETDVHIEADIRALPGNGNGFGPGEWVPYLSIAYEITKEDSDFRIFGSFMPMVASDGPHYGANVKLDGPGKYHVAYRISPPPFKGFYRHIDEETGVGEWWAPFNVEWDFAFLGVGKKGGY